MDIVDDFLFQEIIESLRFYVIENPESTQTECVILVMGFGLSQEKAVQVISLIGKMFADINGTTMTFEDIKQMSINAASIEAPEIDLGL